MNGDEACDREQVCLMVGRKKDHRILVYGSDHLFSEVVTRCQDCRPLNWTLVCCLFSFPSFNHTQTTIPSLHPSARKTLLAKQQRQQAGCFLHSTSRWLRGYATRKSLIYVKGRHCMTRRIWETNSGNVRDRRSCLPAKSFFESVSSTTRSVS